MPFEPEPWLWRVTQLAVDRATYKPIATSGHGLGGVRDRDPSNCVFEVRRTRLCKPSVPTTHLAATRVSWTARCPSIVAAAAEDQTARARVSVLGGCPPRPDLSRQTVPPPNSAGRARGRCQQGRTGARPHQSGRCQRHRRRQQPAPSNQATLQCALIQGPSGGAWPERRGRGCGLRRGVRAVRGDFQP